MRIIPCRVAWCDSATHPAENILRHRSTLAEFPDQVHIDLAWAERRDGRPTVGPHLQVYRGPRALERIVDLNPGTASLWARLIAGLAPEAVLQFAATLLSGATLLNEEGGL